MLHRRSKRVFVTGTTVDITENAEPTADVLDDSVMEVDEKKAKDKTKFKLSLKSLKNEHGNYPVWMNQRKIKSLQRCAKGKKPSRTPGSTAVRAKPVRRSGIMKKKKGKR